MNIGDYRLDRKRRIVGCQLRKGLKRVLRAVVYMMKSTGPRTEP